MSWDDEDEGWEGEEEGESEAAPRAPTPRYVRWKAEEQRRTRRMGRQAKPLLPPAEQRQRLATRYARHAEEVARRSAEQRMRPHGTCRCRPWSFEPEGESTRNCTGFNGKMYEMSVRWSPYGAHANLHQYDPWLRVASVRNLPDDQTAREVAESLFYKHGRCASISLGGHRRRSR